jgi:hypothetical protein
MRYLVRGICLVPTEAGMEVEADTPEQAVEIAQAEFRKKPRNVIYNNGGDDSSAFDWQPTAEEQPATPQRKPQTRRAG